MIKYIDKFGKEIKKGDVLLNYRNNGARVGVTREIDNLLYFCCQSYYDSEQGRIPLCEMDLSKLSVFDIATFNKKNQNKGIIRYYDKNGIEIREEMCLFIGNENSGNGSPIKKQGNDLMFGFGSSYDPHLISLSKLMARNKNIDFIVEFIPAKYL